MELAGDSADLTTFLFADNAQRATTANATPGSDNSEEAVSEFRQLLKTATTSHPQPEQSNKTVGQSVHHIHTTKLTNSVNEQLESVLADQNMSESLAVTQHQGDPNSRAFADGQDALLIDTRDAGLTTDSQDSSLQSANPMMLTLATADASPHGETRRREPTLAMTRPTTTVSEQRSSHVAPQADKSGDSRSSVPGPARLGGSSDNRVQSVLTHTNIFSPASDLTDATTDETHAQGSNARVGSLQAISSITAAQHIATTAQMHQSHSQAQAQVQVQSIMSSLPGTASATVLPIVTDPSVTAGVKNAESAMTNVSLVPQQGLSSTPAYTLETAGRLKTMSSIRDLPPKTTAIADTVMKPSFLTTSKDAQPIHDQAASTRANGIGAELSMGKVPVADAGSIQHRMSPRIKNGGAESIVTTVSPSGDLVAALTPNSTALPNSLRGIDTTNIQSPQSAIDLQAPQLPTKLGGQIRLMAEGGVQSAVLQIKPAELGPVHIEVSVDNDRLTVNISATQAVTRELLESALPRLREQLSPQQFSQIDVNVSAQERGQGQGAFGQAQSSADRRGAGLTDQPPMASRQEPDDHNHVHVGNRPVSSSLIDAYV